MNTTVCWKISKIDFYLWIPWAAASQDSLTLSSRRFVSYRNQSIDLQRKSIDWFLYNRDLCHERVKEENMFRSTCSVIEIIFSLKLGLHWQKIDEEIL